MKKLDFHQLRKKNSQKLFFPEIFSRSHFVKSPVIFRVRTFFGQIFLPGPDRPRTFFLTRSRTFFLLGPGPVSRTTLTRTFFGQIFDRTFN